MTFLPIVERELRVRARQGATYHGRWIAVLLAVLISLPFLPDRGVPVDGKKLFLALTILAFAYSLFNGGRLTCDALSSEKRGGTLTLLFLTHLKGYDVVLGKLVSSSLTSFYGLLAVMPVFGLALFMGGVSGGEFWRVSLVLVNTLFFSLALGLWVSARCEDEHKILAGTNLLLLAIAGAFPLIDFLLFSKPVLFSMFSPGYGCYLALDGAYQACPRNFWMCLGLIHAAAWMFVALAGKTIFQYRQEMGSSEERARPAKKRTAMASPRRLAQRQALLSTNPVLWLVRQQRGQKALIWSMAVLWLGLIALGILLDPTKRGRTGGLWTVVPTPGILYLPQIARQLVMLMFWYAMASIACRFFVKARRSGTLELLLCTPLSDQNIFDGLWQHLRKLLVIPLLCILAAQLAASFCFGNLEIHAVTLSYVQIILLGIGLCVQGIAICFVGLWLALSCKRTIQAAARTFVLVVFLPWLFCTALPYYALIPLSAALGGNPAFREMVGIANPIIPMFVHLLLISWARDHLEHGIRAAASGHLTSESPPLVAKERADPKTDCSEYYSLLK